MRTMRLKTRLPLRLAGMCVLAAWLTGCVTPQPIPSNSGVVVSDISPDEVRQSSATGAIVRWGGTITGISNQADGTTAIELVSRPLYNGGRPIHSDTTAGRFIAETADFLDPEIVKVGRDFTLVGEVVDLRDGKVGETAYRFPVVAVDNYRYWNKRNTVPSGNYRFNNRYSPYRYDPFYRNWPFPPYRRHNYLRSGISASFVFIHR